MPHFHAAIRALVTSGFAAWGLLVCAVGADAEDASRDVAFFESKVRPVLAARCYECHSRTAKQIHGGMTLDTPAGLKQGGESGPLLLPGKPDESPLIHAIGYSGDVQMPPEGKIPAEEIALLTEWVRRGAPMPTSDVESGTASGARKAIDFDAGRKHWSFQPPRKSSPPKVQQADWPRKPIDHFILSALEARALKPSPPADARTLIRRASFDLLGLPPTAEEVERFEALYCRPPAPPHSHTSGTGARDYERTGENAYAALLDRLLESPHYGERWGRHWLDLARFADGNTTSLESRSQAWLYRDWVVQALNADLPYNEFVLRQLAADQMPDLPPSELAALGFFGVSPEYFKELKLAPSIIQMIVADEWEERIDALGRTFLGLSLGCARCHDHKYDPVSTEDYYALAGVLASSRLTDRYVVPEAEAKVVREATARCKKIEEELQELRKDKQPSDEKKAKIEEFVKQAREIENSTPRYRSAASPGLDDAALFVLPSGPNHTKLEYKPGEAINLRVQIRGNPARLGKEVPRRFLTVLSKATPAPFQHGSGRLELAQAILREGQPLSARVMVNRVWKLHFGRGLVDTTSDFGTQGSRPSHPELLDDLTCRFIESGWSLKWLHREIMLSAAYRQSSCYDAAKFAVDPDNRLLWRQTRRRLEVEAWRDALLASCGNLDRTLGGPSIAKPASDHHRRTLYGKIDRAALDVLLRLYDFPDPATHSPDREPTTTSLQQLFVLNGPFMRQQADVLAKLLLAAGGKEPQAVVSAAYRQLWARAPSEVEQRLGSEFLAGKLKDDKFDAERVRQYAQALLGSNEFLFID